MPLFVKNGLVSWIYYKGEEYKVVYFNEEKIYSISLNKVVLVDRCHKKGEKPYRITLPTEGWFTFFIKGNQHKGKTINVINRNNGFVHFSFKNRKSGRFYYYEDSYIELIGFNEDTRFGIRALHDRESL